MKWVVFKCTPTHAVKEDYLISHSTVKSKLSQMNLSDGKVGLNKHKVYCNIELLYIHI